MYRDKAVLTTGEVARLCHVAARTVSKWFDSGQLKGYRIPGSRDRRIPVEALVRFMQRHNMPTDGLGQTRVLVVERDEQHAEELQKGLVELGGYCVAIAANALAIGVTLERLVPHIMVINMQALGVDTMDVCIAIRQLTKFEGLRILVTGSIPEDLLRPLRTQVGIDGCLAEAGDIVGLIHQIETTLAVIY